MHDLVVHRADLFWRVEGNLSPSTSLPASFQQATVTLDPSPNVNHHYFSTLALISADFDSEPLAQSTAVVEEGCDEQW